MEEVKMNVLLQEPELISDPVQIAEEAGLRYVNDAIPGYTRRRKSEKYLYFDQYGELIESGRTLQRIHKLVIPHIWENVWICPFEKGHLQATGVDTRKRKQYRYHKEWEKARNLNKFSKMLLFGSRLPQIRETLQQHFAARKLTREKVLATVITLLDEKLIRIGNREYERRYNTYGLTTLKDRHVRNLGGKILIQFRGKKNIDKEVIVSDRRLASVIRKCKELPGYDLFQYYDDDGRLMPVTSEDVNTYLKEISGEDFTAKDFRTWGGSCIAIRALLELGHGESEKEIKKNIVSVIKRVSGCLGNTPNVCKKYYIHPQIFEAYSSSEIAHYLEERGVKKGKEEAWLNHEEQIFMELLMKKF